MGNEIRRSLDELVTRYELEPELRDIYVEGKTDKLLLEWFLEQKGQQDFAVYEIDTVDISAQRLFELGLNDSKRGRVIALARTPVHSKLTNFIDLISILHPSKEIFLKFIRLDG